MYTNELNYTNREFVNVSKNELSNKKRNASEILFHLYETTTNLFVQNIKKKINYSWF